MLINICVIIIILILIFWQYRYTYEFLINNDNTLDYYDFGISGKKIVFIAGVHGNEPAASLLFADLLKTNYFVDLAKRNNVCIRVIPWVNKVGLQNNNRYQPNILYPDINRNFTENGEGKEPVSQALLNLVSDSDLIIDFHEGWGYHLIDSKSIGSTLLPTPNMRPLANIIVSKLNKNINNPKKKFVVINKLCEIPSALDCIMHKKNKSYILVETSGQNNLQPLALRQQQIKTVIETLFMAE